MFAEQDNADAGDTRTRLREAALRLFGHQGVQGTSTREILDAVGLRNPSAITYYFGSKAELVDDLVTELITDAWPVVQLQVDLAATTTPSVQQWTETAVDSAVSLISTERGRLLACLWWEYDSFLYPDAFEQFLGSGVPLAVDWLDAIGRTFPDLPPVLAVARNLVVVRTLEWLVARRARRILTGRPAPGLMVQSPEAVREALLEMSLALLTAPNSLTSEDITLE